MNCDAHLVGMSKFNDAIRGISDATRLMDLIEPASVRLMREQNSVVNRFLENKLVTSGLLNSYSDSVDTIASMRSTLDAYARAKPSLDTVAMQMASVGRTLAVASIGSTANLRSVGDALPVGGPQRAMESIIAVQALIEQRHLGHSAVDGLTAMTKAAQGLTLADADLLTIQNGVSAMASALRAPSIHSAIAEMQAQYFASLKDTETSIPEEIAEDPKAFAERVVRWVTDLATAFNANSKQQLADFGILDLMMVIGLLLTIQSVLDEPETYGDEERLADDTILAGVEENAQLLSKIESSIENLNQIVEEKQAEWLSSLDRAIVSSGRARIRDLPDGKAKAIAQLERDQNVAIVTKKGRWFQVAYPDPITDDIAVGWIYESSLTPLD